MAEKVTRQELGSGHGTERVFFVEARSTTGPQSVGGKLLADKWERLHFKAGPNGVVPAGPLVNAMALHCGFMDYEAADALAACFRALLCDDRPYRPYGIETRIVVVRFTYDYKAERVTEGDAENRSNHQLQRVDISSVQVQP